MNGLSDKLSGCYFSSKDAQALDETTVIIRTWVAQLIQTNDEVLNVAYAMKQEQRSRKASEDDLWNLLREAISQTGPTILALDGLDEFERLEDSRKIFLQALKKHLASTRALLLITSRDEVDIESELSATTSRSDDIAIFECKMTEQCLKHDLRLFAELIVQKKLPNRDRLFRQELVTDMVERCGGMFLWIRYQQDRLLQSRSNKILRETVQSMPRGLNESYSRTWKVISNLEPDRRDRVINLLRWLAFANRPLSVQELAECLSIEVEGGEVAFDAADVPTIDEIYIDDEIKEPCGSLLDFRYGRGNPAPNLRMVHLIHASVRDFLIEVLPSPSLTLGTVTSESSSVAHNLWLAALCIKFLNSPDAWSLQRDNNQQSFLIYATQAWYKHIWAAEGKYEPIVNLVNDFMAPGNRHFAKWASFYEYRYRDSAPQLGRVSSTNRNFYYACLFGLCPTMELLHNTGVVNLNTVSEQSGTPLHAACCHGHTGAFARLLRWGADTTLTWGRLGDTLTVAAYFDRLQMVRSILEDDDATKSWTSSKQLAMMRAAKNGHLTIVKLLIEYGANVETRNSTTALMGYKHIAEFFTTPLHLTVESGHLHVVEYLISHGASLQAVDRDGLTSLHLAAESNQMEVLKCLLEHGANIHATSEHGTPLHLAVQRGHVQVATELLDKGARADSLSSQHLTPLHDAATHGQVNLIHLLLESGADIDSQDTLGITPLIYAGMANQIHAVKALILGGADVSAQRDSGWTILSYAVLKGNIDLLKLVLDEGARSQTLYDGWTSLHLAAEKGFVEILKLLLVHGFDVNARNETGLTPLHCVVNSETPEIAELLLTYGAIMTADAEGCTPLHLTAKLGKIKHMMVMIQAGADIDAQSNTGATPLHSAVRSHEDVHWQLRVDAVTLLLESGARVSTCYFGNTLLHVAASYGRTELIPLLLQKEQALNKPARDGFTPLLLALRHQQGKTARLLLSEGANPNVPDERGRSPLYYAADYDDLHTIQLLIDKKCEINTQKNDGSTPLRKAIERGSDELVRYLIGWGADLRKVDCYGMTCFDWLQLLRPDFRLPSWRLEGLSDLPKGPNQITIRQTILDIATKASAEADFGGVFTILAKCFIWLKMNDNARQAYVFRFYFDGNAGCDGCDILQTQNAPFFACKTCPDIDLCQDCMTLYRQKNMLPVCRNHHFLRSVVRGHTTSETQKSDLNDWLKSIEQQFKHLCASDSVPNGDNDLQREVEQLENREADVAMTL